MKALPTQERAQKKRQAILDAAQLEFTEKDYEKTTAKSITARAGVATGTFYQYFTNKEEVLLVLTQARFDYLQESIIQPDINTLHASDHTDIRELFKIVVILIYEFHENDPGFHQVLEHRRSMDSALNTLIEKGESVLMDRTKQFVCMFNCKDPDTIAFCLFAMAEGLVHRHVFTPSNVTKSEVIDLGVELLSSYFEKLNNK
ncbi:hypothetical protein A9Q99_00300 [Gammaproteobacteria bacterium 45_16_T64]|nr:hypothetical protein A9Q99_00300 [Gammaproteobacteria bacterium 45_16_T64]